MNFADPQFLLSIVEIIWIDLLLSGDNAVVIALAVRSLPPDQRRIGMLLGAGTAVGLRIVFALIISTLLAIPFLRIVGGILLLWIAVKLAKGEDEEGHAVAESETLWKAVRTIAIADAVMSLDNVVAISAASKGHAELFIFGLLLSIPLIVMGAALISSLLKRFPIIVWAGAALLGWIAGEMIVTDPFVAERVAGLAQAHYFAAVAGAVFVVGLAYFLKRNQGPAVETTAERDA